MRSKASARRARRGDTWRVVAIAAVAACASPASSQQILLTVTKGADPVRDVHLRWTAPAGSASEVFRGRLPDGAGRLSLAWLCGLEHVDSDSASPPGGIYYYEVEPYAGPGALRADGGPDVGTGRAIGGSPTASGGNPPYTYAWTPLSDLTDPASANPVATPLVDAVYTITVSDADGCTASDTVEVLIPASPLVADAGPDPPAALPCGYAARVALGGSPASTGGVTPHAHEWSPTLGLVDDDLVPQWNRANPLLVPFDDLTYTLTVTDRISDQATDRVSVTVDKSLAHCAGFGDYTIPPDWCAVDFNLVDQDCNPFRFHDQRCKVVLLQFGDFT